MDQEIKQTPRGFDFTEFEDYNGVKCSIQKSSLATDDLIWIGCDDADPKALKPVIGWHSVAHLLPKDTIFNTRMHLTREQVKALMPVLKHFVKTGELE